MQFDNLVFPVIICDKESRITYKNHAAKRCIPSPRRGGFLSKHINTKMDRFTVCADRIKVVYIINDHSLFNRAFVICKDNEDIWLFSPELVLAEPESIPLLDKRLLNEFSRQIFELSENEEYFDKVNISQRFHRIQIEILTLLKRLPRKDDFNYHRLCDIIPYVHDSLKYLSQCLNFKFIPQYELSSFYKNHKIRFIPFVITYTYLVQLLLRVSNPSVCFADMELDGPTLLLRLETTAAVPASYIGKELENNDIFSLFEDNSINMMIIYQISYLNKFKFNILCPSQNRIRFELHIPLNDNMKDTLFHPKQEAIIQREFGYISRRLSEVMHNILYK